MGIQRMLSILRNRLAFFAASVLGASALALVAGLAFTAHDGGLPWSATGSSGNVSLSPNHELTSTSGQAAIGVASGDNGGLCAGFSCGARCIDDGDGLVPATELARVPPTDPCDPDTDDDGCFDGREIAGKPNAAFGGGREPTYFWDFFDVWTHPAGQPTVWERNRVINVFDILGVALRFGFGQAPPAKEQALTQALIPPTDNNSYHPAFDRSPLVGPNAWDSGPPDGTINVINDVLVVAQQFGHSCA